MRKLKSSPRPVLFLIFLLLGMVGWNTLPTHLCIRPVEAAANSLATEPGSQLAPRAVANGKIAFVSDREISTMNPDGSDVKQLTFDAGTDLYADIWALAWSPDGSKIVFDRLRPETGHSPQAEHLDIVVVNGDGSSQRVLTSSGPGEYNYYAAWSPDGSKITFIRERVFPDFSKTSEVQVMNADGSNQHKLADGNGDFGSSGLYAFGATWSPDGTQIAFSRNLNIYVINADGSNERLILNGYFDPLWSPDGSKLAVTRLPQPGGIVAGVWVVNVDGSNLTQIYKPEVPSDIGGVFDDGHVWSPDGSKIAFTEVYCRSNCNDDIGESKAGVVNADGSDPIIIQDVGNDQGILVIWSPDGTKILSPLEDIFGYYHLFTMNPDGSALTKISDRAAGDLSWQSLPLIPPTGNPIDDAQFFVRQHYHDFLNREADADGLAFWTNEINLCGSEPGCIQAKRINVSGAFFLSIEFQQTGYLVYRIYKTSYGNLPDAPVPVRFNEFLNDTQQVEQGVVVNQTGWEQSLENNKQKFASEFVQRSRFTSVYPTSLTPAEFVDKLFANAGVTPSMSDRADAINEFGLASSTTDPAARARTLRRVAENSILAQQEFNRAFVLMQYFGYLRRDPNDSPEPTLDFQGYNFWLNKLKSFDGNFTSAEMVKAFITATEYRQRFGAP